MTDRIFRLPLAQAAVLLAVASASAATLDVPRLPAPAVADLDAGETALIVGWNSGEWFLRPAGLRERLVHAPADGPAPRCRTLRAAIRVNAAGAQTAVEFNDDAGGFAFDGFPPTPPLLWLAPENWDLLRVTVRGAAIAEEDVRVRFLPDGSVIILR